ncbi:uncharacterized protein AFUA_2G07530 [Aspergillus fumigatus Af293]|uniref:Uncharacterized protein n=2 Tax=Aspergillus fumigatus TaxID=746128 RepID=Q4X264_ASPFU|nr:conserved hypothetical protein [Aspergillus fumigatus Af293]EAL93051.1 conserved hypothetical protein [Aspergillus fumigatus Af293]EDP54302.1 conserved hypothetical protein [Aspergillus fumigatus A1163]
MGARAMQMGVPRISSACAQPVCNFAAKSSTILTHICAYRIATCLVSLRLPARPNHNARLVQQTLGSVSHWRASSQLSRAIMPRPGTAAETYVAYGMTQKLFEVCSSQADYSIPQLSQKGAQVPKTEAGEDLGVGEGWWYEAADG